MSNLRRKFHEINLELCFLRNVLKKHFFCNMRVETGEVSREESVSEIIAGRRRRRRSLLEILAAAAFIGEKEEEEEEEEEEAKI